MVLVLFIHLIEKTNKERNQNKKNQHNTDFLLYFC